jgi:hypothetical protein
MAFTVAVQQRPIAFGGSKRIAKGTFVNTSGDTGGDIDTGLRICETMILQHTGAAVVTDAPSVNETMPCDGSEVTIVTVADTSGDWIAIGI